MPRDVPRLQYTEYERKTQSAQYFHLLQDKREMENDDHQGFTASQPLLGAHLLNRIVMMTGFKCQRGA